MSDVRSWDVAAANNNSAAPDGFPEGMDYSDVNNAAREVMAAIKRWFTDISGATASTGSSNAYVLAAADTVSAYAAGMRFRFVANHTNTGAATLNVDSVGATTIRKFDPVAGTFDTLHPSDIVSGQIVEVIYEAATPSWVLMNPSSRQAPGASFYVGDSGSGLALFLNTTSAVGIAALLNGSATTLNLGAAGQDLNLLGDNVNAAVDSLYEGSVKVGNYRVRSVTSADAVVEADRAGIIYCAGTGPYDVDVDADATIGGAFDTELGQAVVVVNNSGGDVTLSNGTATIIPASAVLATGESCFLIHVTTDTWAFLRTG